MAIIGRFYKAGNVARPSGGADWIPAMAGSLHPPCRRKKLRPLRPRLGRGLRSAPFLPPLPTRQAARGPSFPWKKLRPLRPRLTARTALCSVPSSSPHAAGRAGAPVFLPEGNETAPAGACRRPTDAKRRLLGRRQTGRARSKREKEGSPLRGGEGRGTRKRCFLRVRMSSARGVVRAGVLVVDEWTFSSFRCR